MTLPNFSYPSKLHSKLTEAPPEKNGPRDIQNQHIHLTCQRKSFQSSSNPSSRSESCSTKTCDANEKKHIGNIFGVLGMFWLHQKFSNQWWPSTPQNETAAGAPWSHPFFFRRRRVRCSLDLLGRWVFFGATFRDLIWKFLVVCECQWYICGSFSSDSYGDLQILRILQVVSRLPLKMFNIRQNFSWFTVLSLEKNRSTPILAETFPYVLMSIFWIEI